MANVFIYALKDPDTGQIRYVGKAKNPTQRLYAHLRGSHTENNYRVNWINFLRASGKRPELEVIDEVPEEYWRQIEAAYIEYFRECGCMLVNGTDGGEGTCLPGEKNGFFGKKHTPESRAKMSIKGRKHSPESRLAKVGRFVGSKNGMFGKQSPRRGKKCSPETVGKMKSAKRFYWERKRQENILAQMWT